MSAVENSLSSVPGIVSSAPLPTDQILATMMKVSEKVSDLIFSPGRAPQVELNGALTPVPGLAVLTADDTRRIANDLMGNNQQALTSLREAGSADLSYSLSGASRFRVNIFS